MSTQHAKRRTPTIIFGQRLKLGLSKLYGLERQFYIFWTTKKDNAAFTQYRLLRSNSFSK